MKLSALFYGVLAALPLARAFSNPVIWEDLADLDIRQYNGTYYYSASTMHYSPGAPILRSYDLFNWEYVGHSVPSLADFGIRYTLTNGQNAYVKGIWASFFAFNSHTSKWIWGGCIEFSTSYIYTANAVDGTWSKTATINKCYYDSGLLIDDDGTLYVSYSSGGSIYVAQLSSSYSEVKSQLVWTPPSSIGDCEGTRMYKRNGKYYILTDHPASQEYTLQASSPFGSYSYKVLVNSITGPVTGGNPHQGGIVSTPQGNWYYMAFEDNYPGGRIPVLAPITWGSDGFPTLQVHLSITVNGGWGLTYSDPVTAHPLASLTGADSLSFLGPQWEWNHVPDTTKYSTGSNGLLLKTATVTSDLYAARNTLTHRILGPASTATVKLNYASMADGDRAGLAMFRHVSGWVGVKRDSGAYTVCMVTGITQSETNWSTTATGTTSASVSISGGTIFLRATANIAPGSSTTAIFSYSTDGTTFHTIGSAFALNTDWQYFMGYRFGIFNYATAALGGQVTVGLFQLDSGSGGPVSGGGSGTTTIGTTATTTTTSAATTTTGGSGGCTTARYGQCGGTGYTGCTTCASGSTCTYSNDFYSQCL
ncbi:glycosyl hydrolase [Mycena belliarum]|uniref:Glycosyl hydrolase n=1 Tax=Mycena belliarum TaxID=1033014 RepID=A0AAD6XWZ9_9AGAR|nr:glycosyl hydrolase [Mycena belliae]